MKNLILLITLFVLFSCESNCGNTNTKNKTTEIIGNSGTLYKVETIEIDGCEYFFRSDVNNKMFTHKGNCKNHRNN